MAEERALAPSGDTTADAEFDQIEAAAQEQIGSAAPEASEPLQPDLLKTLHDSLGAVFNFLGQGQAPPMPEFAPPEEGSTQMPAPTFTRLAALDQAVSMVSDDPDAERYSDFSLDLAASNDGIVDLTAMANEMAQDSNLLAAMQRAGTQAPAEEAPEAADTPDEGAPKDQDLDEFVR